MEPFLRNSFARVDPGGQAILTLEEKEKNSMTIDHQPWVEKYRPSTLEQVAGQEETVKVLSKSIQSMNLPHMLFYGPPGTGKTSTILALAKEIYGPELFKARVLELNASDERGISIIRNKVKNFAQIAVGKGSKGPPYKLIILDEADSMTVDAQAALRRTMETYSHITRFCLICNYMTRIIEPLASRCAKFRFQPLANNLMIQRLEYITEKETMNVTRQTLDALVNISNGDLRQAVTLLQTAKKLCTMSSVTPEQIFEMTGTIPENLMDQLFTTWQSKNVFQIQQALTLIFRNGYAGLQLLEQIHHEIVTGSRFDKVQKQNFAVSLARCEKRLIDGSDEEIQLLNVLICFA